MHVSNKPGYHREMKIKNVWQRMFLTAQADDLEYIRQDIITSILALMVFVAWLTLWASFHYKQPGYFWATLILLAGVLLGAKLRASHKRGALYSIIITLTGTIVCVKWFFPESQAQYYFPLVVLLSGFYESNVSTLIIAAVVSIPCIVVA